MKNKLVKTKSGISVRSQLEKKILDKLTDEGRKFEYESLKINYVVPSSLHVYTPDLVLESGIIIEIKGYFLRKDRVKMELIKAQHPDLDLRFVFSDANKALEGAQKRKDGTRMSNREWAEKYGYQYAEKDIPQEWLDDRN